MIKYLISNLVITICFIGIVEGLQILYLLRAINEIVTIICVTMIYVCSTYSYGLSVKYLRLK